MLARSTILALLCSLLVISAALGQDSLNVTKVGEILLNTGYVNKAVIIGNYTYIACGAGLVITTNSVPVQLVGYCLLQGGPAQAITVVANYAYIVEYYHELRVVDISNPASPVEVGSCYVQYYLRDVAVAGNYAYVVGDGWGIFVIDVSNPTSPFVVGNCYPSDLMTGVVVVGDYAYVSSGWYMNGTLWIMDVSNPTLPQVIGSCSNAEGMLDVVVYDNYAYVANGESGLAVIDVSNPTSPFVMGSCDTPWNTAGVSIAGDHAYIADVQSLRIIDISNPASPFETGSYGYSTYEIACDVAMAGNYAFVIDQYFGMWMVDASNPHSPFGVQDYQMISNNNKVALKDNYAYLAATGISISGLRIVNISSPGLPQQVGFYALPEGVQSLATNGDFVYATYGNGLGLIDISNPVSPQLVGYCGPFGMSYARGMAVEGNYIYVAASDGGLNIIDVSTPSSPAVIGSCATTGLAEDVAVQGNYAYVAAYSHGLRVIDVSNPTSPVEVGSLDSLGSTNGIVIYGNYAFITKVYYPGLWIINVADPQSPFQAGFIETPGCISDLVVAGNFLIYTEGVNFGIINITNPSNPFESGFYETPVGSGAKGVEVTNNYAYVTNADYFGIYDCSAALAANPWETPEAPPADFALNPPSPNPFNPSTTLSYELRVPSSVSMKIFDTSGRLITILVNEKQSAGSHTTTFDGTDLPSGLYFARLQATEGGLSPGAFTQTRKLVLLK